MSAPGEWRCLAAALAPGTTVAFRLRLAQRHVRAFVVHHGGSPRAYVNRCPHAGTPLDLWPDEFLSEDGRWLVCATHGALFEPATGRCVSGPCAGAALEALPVRHEGDELVVSGGGP